MPLALLSRGSADAAWGEQALQWLQARDDASRRSVAELALFEAPDGWDVSCCYQSRPLHGRAEQEVFAGDTPFEGIDGHSYIDVTGSIVEYRFPPITGDVAPNELLVSEHATDGAATLMTHPLSLRFLQDPHFLGIQGFGTDLTAAQSLTDAYLSAWSGRDGHAVSNLYASKASLLDSLLGVRIAGRDAIGGYATDHAGVPLRQDVIPRDGGPALYGFWREPSSPLIAYVTYTGRDGNGCPGAVAAQLQIEHGQIVAERRYHDVASMRRCVNTARLPEGWWTRAVIPPPIHDQITGLLTAAGRRIEVHNGNSGAEELLRWGMTRFPAAQLAAPDISDVAFDEEIHRQQCSTDRWGLSVSAGSSSQIFLCFTVSTHPTSLQRETLLHELAHAWMWQNLTGATREDFLTLMHLRTWDSRDVSWDQRAIEHAADVIVWGITDPQIKSDLLASRACTQLTAAFQLLTHGRALQACPQTPATGP